MDIKKVGILKPSRDEFMKELRDEIRNDNRTEKKKQPPIDAVIVPIAVIDSLYKDINRLAQMHADLIGLYQKESELKKHHKAYLHVRDYADQVCLKDLEEMSEMMPNYLDPVVVICGE